MTRVALSALAAASAVALSGCWDTCGDVLCGPCPPMLTVTVTSSDGSALQSVSTTDARVSCGQSTAASWQCSDQGAAFEPGDTVELDVTAPGFQPQHVKVTIPPLETEGCCSCGYQPQTIPVTLTPQ